MLPADYVTDDAGTGFVHTAPGHGADDYNTFVKHKAAFAACGTPEVPHTVGRGFGYLPGRAAASRATRIYDDKGKDGGANEAVISEARRGRRAARPRAAQASVPAFLALEGAADLPQHAAMVHRHGQAGRRSTGDTLRHRAPCRDRRDREQWVPARGREPHHRHDREPARLGDVAPARLGRADRGVRRARAPTEILKDERVNEAIAAAFETEGADAWFADAAARFLAPFGYDPAAYEKVTDILDVWFDSGSTHAFTLEIRDRPRRRAASSTAGPTR